jgi:hypothetical protein
LGGVKEQNGSENICIIFLEKRSIPQPHRLNRNGIDHGHLIPGPAFQYPARLFPEKHRYASMLLRSVSAVAPTDFENDRSGHFFC